MNTHSFIHLTVAMTPLVVALTFAPATGQVTDPQSEDERHGPPAVADPNVADESGEDTLQACMARVPKDASIGQRMIAEQSCWRDENDRQPIRSVPQSRGISR